LFVYDRLVERFGGAFYLAAMNLLSESRLPVKRIAQGCGFGSEQTLRRSLLLVTPQDYRARFRF
jgi:transcriptional regulator GlxA family with amidase domain